MLLYCITSYQTFGSRTQKKVLPPGSSWYICREYCKLIAFSAKAQIAFTINNRTNSNCTERKCIIYNVHVVSLYVCWCTQVSIPPRAPKRKFTLVNKLDSWVKLCWVKHRLSKLPKSSQCCSHLHLYADFGLIQMSKSRFILPVCCNEKHRKSLPPIFRACFCFPSVEALPKPRNRSQPPMSFH